MVVYFHHRDGEKVKCIGWDPFPPHKSARQTVPERTNSGNRGKGSGLTVAGAFRARDVARVAVSDTAVGAGGILTTLGAA